MTPFGLRLQLDLSNERQRMANEWFFKWHQIGGEHPVEIDSFNGQKIVYGGIKFWGSPRIVYWQTITSYLRKKIAETFNRAEKEIASYPPKLRNEAIEETRGLVGAFVQQLINDAVDKDKILRGDGFKFPPSDRGQINHSEFLAAIDAQTNALKKLFAEEKTNHFQKVENALKEHKELAAFMLVFIGGAFALIKFFFGK